MDGFADNAPDLGGEFSGSSDENDTENFSGANENSFKQVYLNALPEVSVTNNEHLKERIRQGDKSACLPFAYANLRTVPFILRGALERYGDRLNFMELVTIGNDALMDSMNTFDPEKGGIVTHARFRIKAAINREIEKQQRRDKKYYSLDAPLQTEEDESATWLDMVEDDSRPGPMDTLIAEEREESRSAFNRLINSYLNNYLRQHPKNWRTMFRMSHGLGKWNRTYNNREIGEHLGVTREAVRQAVNKMEDGLKKYLSQKNISAGSLDLYL